MSQQGRGGPGRAAIGRATIPVAMAIRCRYLPCQAYARPFTRIGRGFWPGPR